jgi:class 3 adenylate cyclase
MGDTSADGPRESLDELLRKREELDRRIQQGHQKDMAIMFADLQGPTTLYEQQGDIDGDVVNTATGAAMLTTQHRNKAENLFDV